MRRHLCTVLTDQRGIVLVVALMLIGLLSALATAYSTLVKASTTLRGGAGRERHGFYAAEAGLNVGMAQFSDIFSNYNVPTSGNGDFNLKTTTLGTRTIKYQLFPVAGQTPGPRTYIPAGQLFGGLASIPYQYTVTSTSVNSQGDQETTLGAEFTVNNIPIFQFLAYYANDLEIYPGPAAVFHGRIHTNGDLYFGAGTSMAIKDSDAADPAPKITTVSVTSHGKIYRSRKTNYDCTTTPIIIDMAQDADHDGSYDPNSNLGCFGANTPVPQATIATYLGSVKSAVPSISIPPVSDFQRGGSGKFWTLSDLRIVLRKDLGLVNTNFAAVCPAGAVNVALPAAGLYPIEVQNADGSRNTALTNKLWQFMCERRGAIFYNDVPTGGTNTQSSMTSPLNLNDPGKANRYNPNFLGDDRVYRRAGEDTNGDGIIDTSGSNGVTAAAITNNDRNDDICPVPSFTVVGPRPVWRPDFCNIWQQTRGWTLPWPAATVADPGVANLPAWYRDMDYRRGGFYNGREGQWVLMLNVNIRALIDWNEINGNPLFSATDSSNGGLVFFLSVQANDSGGIPGGVRYGVRLFDSATLNSTSGRATMPLPLPSDPRGLTVVSDQAAYIEGNYNYTSVNNNATWYPAAVMADTINVLSQGWEVPAISGGMTYRNDRKTASTMATSRVVLTSDSVNGGGADCLGVCRDFSNATAMGIYAAYLANVDNSVAGGGYPTGYNGGFENYPRFHEDWSNRTLNYRGSYVSLGTPQHANGTWNTQGAFYSPPNRNWDYDARFDDAAMLPPVTPQVVYVQQKVYTRFYK